MYTILHISDLHRSTGDPISNPELISALVSDRESFARENPQITAPQAIIVSGDIIQGVRLGESDSDSKLEAQYGAAYDFLAELSDRFVEGDRSRVVIVPGNHDIDWNQAFSAMKLVDPDSAGDLPGALYEPDSPFRWDWKKRQLYLIDNKDAYNARFAPFWKFFERFYEGTTGLLRVEPWSPANLYSLDNGRIGVAAFNSCAANDCFSFIGEIPRETVAQAHLDLKDEGPWELRIAVWHHDIEGPPSRVDYMDPEIVRGMVGRGFRLGLFGHQHRPQSTPQHAFLPTLESMAVVSAGSLCAGARELPVGARRGYSVIEIADDYCSARVHIREMAYANLFSRARIANFGGESFVDLGWTTPVDAGGRPQFAARDRLAQAVSEAEALLQGENQPRQAMNLLLSSGAASLPYGRKLLIVAAEKLGDDDQLLRVLEPPVDIGELVLGLQTLLRLGDWKKAGAYLASHEDKLEVPGPLLSDLRMRIDLMRRAKE